MTVFGTRPDTIKMAPVVRALREAGPQIVPLVCVTAQHRGMLDDLLALFAIAPDYDLDVMRHDQTIAQITTRVLEGMEPVLRAARPDVVLVHGDTSTSTAAALAAFYAKVPVGHVEAGLRTSTIWEPFPEEMNRRLTGRLASFHFAPTGRARRNLEAENVRASDIIVTGNTVIDAFLAAAAVDAPPEVEAWRGLDPQRPWIFVTAHRRENHAKLPEICAALAEIAALPERPQILFPVHPSPQVAPVVRELLGGVAGVVLVGPLPYDVTVQSIKRATLVLTDSGGLQEEAPCLGKPVLVMRDETERPEGIEAGTLELVGPHRGAIVAATRRLLEDDVAYARMARASNPYGDGHASGRIVAWLLARLRTGGTISGGVRESGNLKGTFEPEPKPENAVSQASLRAYFDRKRPMAAWSVLFAVCAASLIATKSQIAAVALLTGTTCGLANAFLSMRGNERLVEHRSVSFFVFSSIIRIAIFGIVPVEFALHGPAWSMGAYFLGFFTPLALYACIVARAVRTD